MKQYTWEWIYYWEWILCTFNHTDIDTGKAKLEFVYAEVDGGDTYAKIAELYYNEILVIKNEGYISNTENPPP